MEANIAYVRYKLLWVLKPTAAKPIFSAEKNYKGIKNR